MKKPAKVIMLPTESKTHICLRNSDNILIYHNNLVCNKEFVHLKGQHLYIITDFPIKGKDWYINLLDNSISQAEDCIYDSTCKKIVATTNNDLFSNEDIIPYTSLPQIPQSFIEDYVKADGIDKVLVEYMGEESGCENYKDGICKEPCGNAGRQKRILIIS